MFANLSERLRQVSERVRGRGRLTEENIQDAVRDVRRALIEADVALPVVRDLIARVQAKAVGTEINKSLTPGQAFVAILQGEIANQLGMVFILILVGLTLFNDISRIVTN